MLKYLLFIFTTIQPFVILSAINTDSLTTIVATTQNDSLKVSVLNELAFASSYSNAEQALKYLSEAEKIAHSKKLNYGYTQLLGIKAIVYDIGGKQDSARYYFKLSYKLSKRYNYKNLEVKALNGLGMNSWNSGQLKSALQYFFTALRLNDGIQPPKQLSPSIFYNNIGLIYQEMFLFDKALIYHQKAYKIRVDNKLIKETASSLNNIGICYKGIGKLDVAIATYKKGIAVAKSSENYVDYYRLINNLANVYITQSDYQQAIKILYSVLSKSRETGINQRTLINIYGSIAKAYSGNKQPHESLAYAKKGLEIIKKNPGLAAFAEDIYQSLIKNAYIVGQNEDGDNYFEEYRKILDTKFSKNNAAAMAEMELKYQSLSSKKKLLEMETEAEELKIIYFSISTFAFLIGLIGIILYRQQRIKRKQQECEFVYKSEIAQVESRNMLQQQRISISRDLHDNIGSHLSFIISSINNLMYKYKNQNPALIEHLKNIESFAAETIVELRDTIWAMDVEKFQFEDLKTRLISFIEKQRSVNPDFNIEFEVDEKLYEPSLNSFAGITIYRIIQEFTNNTLKHANASKLIIAIKNENNFLDIMLKDNGVGFDLATCSRGHGLYNMEKRCKELNGDIFMHSEPGKGTTVNLTFNTEFLK